VVAITTVFLASTPATATGVDRRAVADGGAEITRRHAARIGRKVAKAEQRRRPREAEAVAQRAPAEILRLEASSPSRFALARQRPRAEGVAGEQEIVALLKIAGDAQLARSRRDGVDGEPGAAPGANGVVAPDLPRQRGERRVDLVFDERRRGRRRAEQRVAAAIGDDHLVVGGRKALGQEGAGDARSDDEHVGRDIAVERLVWQLPHAPGEPDRPPGSEIALLGDHALVPGGINAWSSAFDPILAGETRAIRNS
jgi:hypothetical protein